MKRHHWELVYKRKGRDSRRKSEGTSGKPSFRSSESFLARYLLRHAFAFCELPGKSEVMDNNLPLLCVLLLIGTNKKKLGTRVCECITSKSCLMFSATNTRKQLQKKKKALDFEASAMFIILFGPWHGCLRSCVCKSKASVLRFLWHRCIWCIYSTAFTTWKLLQVAALAQFFSPKNDLQKSVCIRNKTVSKKMEIPPTPPPPRCLPRFS